MLNFFTHLISDRKKQLDTQIEIDNLFNQTARYKCPQTLINFFLLERESNRKQCADVNNSNIWEYPDVISKNMSELERRNNEILSSIKINDICSVLEKLNKELISNNN